MNLAFMWAAHSYVSLNIKTSIILVAIAAIVTIFARYVNLEKFPYSAFFSIGFTFFFSLSSIGLLAVDLSFSLYNQENENKEEGLSD